MPEVPDSRQPSLCTRQSTQLSLQITPDETPPRPVDRSRHEHPRRVVLGPRQARLGLDRKASSARDLGCTCRSQCDDKIVEIDMQVLIDQDALR